MLSISFTVQAINPKALIAMEDLRELKFTIGGRSILEKIRQELKVYQLQ